MLSDFFIHQAGSDFSTVVIMTGGSQVTWLQSHKSACDGDNAAVLEINTSKHRPSPAFHKLKHIWIIRDTITRIQIFILL